jgi:hypothetical protein
MIGWKGRSVLHFGDHPYADLVDASLVHGWKTGAIIERLTMMRLNRLNNYYRNRNSSKITLPENYCKARQTAA